MAISQRPQFESPKICLRYATSNNTAARAAQGEHTWRKLLAYQNLHWSAGSSIICTHPYTRVIASRSRGQVSINVCGLISAYFLHCSFFVGEKPQHGGGGKFQSFVILYFGNAVALQIDSRAFQWNHLWVYYLQVRCIVHVQGYWDFAKKLLLADNYKLPAMEFETDRIQPQLILIM